MPVSDPTLISAEPSTTDTARFAHNIALVSEAQAGDAAAMERLVLDNMGRSGGVITFAILMVLSMVATCFSIITPM